jgi:hypothetical protein
MICLALSSLDPIETRQVMRWPFFFSFHHHSLFFNTSFLGSGRLHGFPVCPFLDFRLHFLHYQDLRLAHILFLESRCPLYHLRPHCPLCYLVIENGLFSEDFRFRFFVGLVFLIQP